MTGPIKVIFARHLPRQHLTRGVGRTLEHERMMGSTFEVAQIEGIAIPLGKDIAELVHVKLLRRFDIPDPENRMAAPYDFKWRLGVVWSDHVKSPRDRCLRLFGVRLVDGNLPFL